MKLIAKILLFVYFLGLLAPFTALVNYYFNSEFIKEVLCFKREEPMTLCNGSCYLRAQLRDYYERQKSGAIPESENQNITWEVSFYAIPNNVLNLKKISKVEGIAIYIIKDYPPPYQRVFHPPKWV